MVAQETDVFDTYIVTNSKSLSQLLIHSVVIDRHEGSVNHNTECNEEIDEGIHDKQFYNPCEAVPARGALPAKYQVQTLGLQPLLLWNPPVTGET